MNEKVIKFIELKVTEKRAHIDYFEYHEIDSIMEDPGSLNYDEVIEISRQSRAFRRNFNTKKTTVPVSRFCEKGKPDLHIAFSEDVSNLFEKPINAIIEQNETLSTLVKSERSKAALWHSKYNKLSKINFVSRLKFLFSPTKFIDRADK